MTNRRCRCGSRLYLLDMTYLICVRCFVEAGQTVMPLDIPSHHGEMP